MRGVLCAACGIALFTGAFTARAQSCPISGSELVLFAAGGRNQGGAGRPRTGPGSTADPGPAGSVASPGAVTPGVGGPGDPASGGPGSPNGAGGPGNQPQTGLAAASNYPPQGIYTACLDESTGQMTLFGIQAKINHSSWLLVDPKKSVVYSTGGSTTSPRDPGSIYSYKIDRATGTLQSLGVSPSGGSDPTHLVFDARSETLYIANHGNGVVGVIKTEADGGTRSLTDQQQQEGSGPSQRQKNAEAHGVALDPTGRFVLCADFGADKIYVYRLDSATGKLSPSSPAFFRATPGIGPRHITFAPDGKHVVMNTELDGQIHVYSWDEKTGTLEDGQVVDPFPAGYTDIRSSAEIGFSRNGRFFYLSLRGHEDKVIAYQWNSAEGKLTEIQRVPSSGQTPWSFGLDPSGKWMVVVNSGSGSVSTFSVDQATGKLEAKGEPLKIGGVIAVAFAR